MYFRILSPCAAKKGMFFMQLGLQGIFLSSWAAKTNRGHHPADAIPAVTGCSNCLLNTLLDTLGVHSNLGNAVHHGGGDLSNTSPAFAIVTGAVGSQKGLRLGHFAEDCLQPSPVDQAVFGLGSHGNEEDKTDDLHADNR